MSIPFVLAFYAVMTAVGAIWLFLTTGSAQPPLVSASGDLLEFCGLALAFAAVTVALTPQLLNYSEPLRGLTREIRDMLGELSHTQILVIAIASGVGEEVLFRAAMQNSLGLLSTSIIFGLLHGFPRTRLAHWGVFAFVVGLGFGLLQEQSSSVIPPALAHFSINYWNLKRIVSGKLNLEAPPDKTPPSP